MTIDDLLAAWEPTVPSEIRDDPLWQNSAYRLATFAVDFVWDDVTLLAQDSRTRRLAEQLFSSTGSIGANYAEAYSRSTDKDRCRIYEYSHGSAREARHWIYASRRIVSQERTATLLDTMSQILRLLTVTIVRERARNSRLSRRIQQR